MERTSAARMADPHGWVHATLGMGDASPCADKLNSYEFTIILSSSFAKE